MNQTSPAVPEDRRPSFFKDPLLADALRPTKNVSISSISEREVTAQPASEHDVSPAWDEAFMRVQSYLHAHQIQSALLLNRLTSEIIISARERVVQSRDVAPVTLAMQEVQQRMAEWFRGAIEEGNWTDARFRARGRLALLLSHFASSSPQDFLSKKTLSEELSASLKISELQAGPEVRLSKMPPAELEFGFGDSDEAPTAPRWVLHPAIGMCFVLVGAMGAAWAVTH